LVEKRARRSTVEGRISYLEDTRNGLVETNAREHGEFRRAILGLEKAILAPPEPDGSGGGILVQMTGLRTEQRSQARRIILILGGLSFGFNWLTPYLPDILRSIQGGPRP